MSQSDEWETPQDLFQELNKEFNFTVDFCATEQNKKCKTCISAGLEHYPLWHWIDEGKRSTESIFCNPPYSNPKKFIELGLFAYRFVRIVFLLKCDTSTKAWSLLWDYETHRPKPGIEIRFLPKRLKFELNGVPSKHSANFPSVIVIMDRRNENTSNT